MNVAPCGDRHDRFHVARLTVYVDGNYCPRIRGDGSFDRVRVNTVRVFIDVGKYGTGARIQNGLNRSDEGVRNRDHFVAATDAQHGHNEMQRGRPRTHTDRLFAIAVLCKLSFELAQLLTKYEVGGIECSLDSRVYLISQTAQLGAEVHERHSSILPHY
jgi:hypothetical protein